MARNGQTTVEAAGTFLFLMLFVFCILNIALISLGKLHSLENVFRVARGWQVNGDSAPHAPARVRTLTLNGMPAGEVVLPFQPLGSHTLPGSWASRMRIVLPREQFLVYSWPGARRDR